MRLDSLQPRSVPAKEKLPQPEFPQATQKGLDDSNPTSQRETPMSRKQLSLRFINSLRERARNRHSAKEFLSWPKLERYGRETDIPRFMVLMARSISPISDSVLLLFCKQPCDVQHKVSLFLAPWIAISTLRAAGQEKYSPNFISAPEIPPARRYLRRQGQSVIGIHTYLTVAKGRVRSTWLSGMAYHFFESKGRNRTAWLRSRPFSILQWA